jgi:hypothetical protein
MEPASLPRMGAKLRSFFLLRGQQLGGVAQTQRPSEEQLLPTRNSHLPNTHAIREHARHTHTRHTHTHTSRYRRRAFCCGRSL